MPQREWGSGAWSSASLLGLALFGGVSHASVSSLASLLMSGMMCWMFLAHDYHEDGYAHDEYHARWMPMVHSKILVAKGIQRRASSDTLMLHQIGSEPYPPQSREEFSQPTTGRDREICCRSDAQALPNTVIP